MNHPVIAPKKLIEVALPLDAINLACGREKSIRHGHPSTLHLWWARRPLAAARAVIFSQLVNDPEDLWRCQNPGKEPSSQTKGHWTKTRARLFTIIEDIVKWENTSNEVILDTAREEIRRSWREVCALNKDHPSAKELFVPDKLPGLHDPFAGGGAIPLEAQRLGLQAFASDLNPVSVLINKAMIEIPSRFMGRKPAHPSRSQKKQLLEHEWKGVSGLADDIRNYGKWVRDEAEKRAGHLYPTVEVTAKMAEVRADLRPYVGQELQVFAWLWARTVKSPNPAFSHIDVPLASSFVISSKAQKESYVHPIIEHDGYRFTVVAGKPPADAKTGTSFGKQKGFRCVMSGSPISYAYIRDEALSGRMGQKLMAIVAEGKRERIYLEPNSEHEERSLFLAPEWQPELEITPGMSERVVGYGMTKYSDLFTKRQIVALTTLCNLINEVREQIRVDCLASGLPDDDIPLDENGTGDRAYGEAVSVYLAFALDKLLDRSCSLVTWFPERDSTYHVFARQALPMSWDFVETNTFTEGSGSYVNAVMWEAETLETMPGGIPGIVHQADSQNQVISAGKVISTDPPYFDNIGYADLSDFFYVWLRRTLKTVYPKLLATIAAPKAEELVATPHRHGTKQKAQSFFLNGMSLAMKNLAIHSSVVNPITIYYAFKQSDTKSDGTNSTGWETFLEAVLKSGLSLTGTWPMRTELTNRLIAKNNNALASSIVLVCRPRKSDSGTISRRHFVRMLNESLPKALDAMTRESEGVHSPVAPVDLSQAIIGPGMAIFSRYDAVLEADGTPMTVKTALQLINRFLAEDDFDADTQFCLHWFEQYGWETGKFGEADVLSRSKGTSVDGVKQAGVLHAAGGNVRLLKWAEYPSEWDPQADQRLPIWEVLHQLIRVFNTDGETGAASVFAAVQSKAEAARQLAYRLYTLCERKNWAEDARAYNEVVTSWSGIESAAAKEPAMKQGELF